MTAYSQKGILFILFALFLAFIAYTAFNWFSSIQIFEEGWSWVPWALALVLFVLLIWKLELLKLKDYERAVIFRLGKFNRVGGPGWTLILPFIEAYKQVDLRTRTLDVERQDTITRDSIEVKIDAVLYIKVKKDTESIKNSVLEIEDFETAAKTFVVASIRDTVGGMELGEVISNIEAINKQVQAGLEEIAKEWGVRVISVQIKDVDIPQTVLEAMHKQKAAVQEKLARIEKANAHKAEINAVKEATEGLSDKALKYYYLKALEEMSHGKSTKIIFPLEFSSLASSIGGSLGAKQSGDQMAETMKKALDVYVSKAVAEAKKKEKKKK